jgi:hypothetical protein
MKKTVVSVLTTATVLMLLVFAAPGFAKGPVELKNALEIDGLGNLNGASALMLNGKPFGIGDRVEAGLLHNASNRPVVLAFSNDRVITLASGQSTSITADAAATQECRCKCGSATITLPAADAAACKAHNGERCENPSGTFRTLSECGLTWVTAVEPVDPIDVPEPGVQ